MWLSDVNLWAQLSAQFALPQCIQDVTFDKTAQLVTFSIIAVECRHHEGAAIFIAVDFVAQWIGFFQ